MATEIKSDQIKSEKLVAIPSANKPTSPVEGMVFRADGTGDSAKGLYEYKNSKWVSLDQSLDSMESVSLITSGDTTALQFAAAINSTSTAAGHKNAVPHEVSTGALDGTFTVPTTGSDALFTDRNANLVFRYASSGTASCKNDYVGITIDIPAAFRGQNLVAEFQYRTEESTTASSNNDFQLSVWDKTNGKSITSTDTSAKSAGAAIAVSSKTGLAVGDKIWLESGGNAVGHSDNTITQSYITSISGTADEITISADWTPASTAGSRLVTKFLSDYDIGLPEADSDTNKDGSTYKLAFKTEATTAQVNLYWQNKSTTANSLELFFDGILVSANKFLQASSQTKSEYYGCTRLTPFWDASGDTDEWDHSALVAGPDTPPLSESRLLTIGDYSGQTRIYAKQNITLAASVFGDVANSGWISIFDSTGNHLMITHAPSDHFNLPLESHTTVKLAKDDYIYFRCNVYSSGTDKYGAAQLVATPQTSDVILLESQDQIFTDWVDYTPSFPTANWAAGGANIVNHCRWRRVGSNMEIDVSFTMSTGTMSTAQPLFPLPSGYSIRSDVIAVNNFTEGFVCRITSTDSLISDGRTKVMAYVAGNSTQLSMVFRAASGTTLTYDPINNLFAAGDTAAGTFSVPIQGWNANFNPLLSMPLVDFGSFENVYSARIAYSTSSPSVTTQSENFIASVAESTSGAGNVDVTFVSGFFTQIPTVSGMSLTQDQRIAFESLSKTGVTIRNTNSVGAFSRHDFCLFAQRQGSDYRQPPQPTAAVIKPAVAIGKVLLAKDTAGGTSATAGYEPRTFNTWTGETWFVSGFTGTLGVGGTNAQFDLDPGTYKVSGTTIAYKSDGCYSLMDSTDNQVKVWGINGRASSGEDLNINNPFVGTFTITEKKTFKIWTYTQTPNTTYGLGVQDNVTGRDEVYGTVMIEKLK